MGGGKEKKQTNQMIGQQYGQEQNAYGNAYGRSQADLSKATGRTDELYDTLNSQYRSLLGGSGLGGAGGAGGDGGGGGGGGGAAPVPGDPRFKEVEDWYRKITDPKTGGWDPERLASLQGDITKIRGIGDDPDIARRMRGNGVFEEFSTSGGYTDADKANIRSRGTSGIPAMYDRMKQQAGRLASVQGGGGPGQAVLMARMGRGQAEAAAGAARDTEIGISEAVRTGRMSAAEAMSQAENRYQSLRGDAYKSAGGMTADLEGDIYGRNKTGWQGIESRAESDRQAAERAAAASAAASRASADDAFRRQMLGLEGLHSLYGAQEGVYGRGLDYELGNRQTSAGIQQGNIGQRIQNNPQRSWMDYLGAGAGIAGAFL